MTKNAWISLTLLNGSKLRLRPSSISMYRTPDTRLGDNLNAKTMVYAGQWYGVEEPYSEIEKLVE